MNILLVTLLMCLGHIYPSQAYDCTDVSLLTIKIYNRNYPGGTPLVAGTVIPDEPIYLLVHAWSHDSTQEWVVKTLPNLLRMYPNCNVVVPDYGAYSKDPTYLNALCTSPYVGKKIADIFIELNLHLDLDLIRCTGPSMGGQVCGAFARRFIELKFGKIARVTAIDLAGPGYDALNKAAIPITIPVFQQSLSKADAQKVVGIYSDGSGTGFGARILPPYSHISIWLNGGLHQPCLTKCILETGDPASCAFCSHTFSHPFYWKAMEGSKTYKLTKCEFPLLKTLSYTLYTLGYCEENVKFDYTEEIPCTVQDGIYQIRINHDFDQIPYDSLYVEP